MNDFDDIPPPAPDIPDRVYIDKMEKILGSFPNIGVPPEPSVVAPMVYLGTSANAENISLLKSMDIKYLLNCAGSGNVYKFRRYKEMYTPETGVMGYQELILEDYEDSKIRPYFERAHGFIDYARHRGCKVLIFCSGVSRSGAIALSYQIRNHIPLLKATRALKNKRRVLLTNEGFIRQVVEYARENNTLDADVDAVYAPRFGRKLDSHRLQRAHLPMFLA
jgi:protein-tyrosine phosphatase